MTFDLLLPLLLFAFVSSVTPGPNNLMVLASSANFGIRKTLPHWLGITSGFMVMIVLVGFGIAGLLDLYPALRSAMKLLCGTFILYLAWKIATTRTLEKGEAAGRPMYFFEAALFQWVNPKAWAMAVTAITLYAPGQTVQGVVFVALAFGFVNLPSMGPWLIAGEALRNWLKKPGRQGLFNGVMAVILVLTMIPVLA